MKTIKLQRVMLIPDTHVPYHNKQAVKLVLKVMQALKPDVVAVLGDFCDFYQVSFHLKDPERALRFEQELRIAGGLLRQIEQYCKKRKIYVHGNHEYRLDRYVNEKAPHLKELIMNQDILGLKEHGWEEVPYKEDTTIGKLFLTHDVGQSGKHSTRQAMEAYMDNVVIGHNHRLDYHVQGNARGIPHVGASFGWLGDVNQIDYMHKMKARSTWALGFGVGYLNSKNGYIYLQPVPIVDGTCCVEGRLFS